MSTEDTPGWKTKDYLKVVPAILIASIIFYLSSLSNPLPPPPPGEEEGFIFLDINTILHACEYAGFSFFIAFGILDKSKGRYVILLGAVFAISDEIHQYFVPNRFFDVYDIIVDIIGVLLGLIAFLLIRAMVNEVKNRKSPGSSTEEF